MGKRPGKGFFFLPGEFQGKILKIKKIPLAPLVRGSNPTQIPTIPKD